MNETNTTGTDTTGTDTNTRVTITRRVRILNDCWCGCGGKTASRFVPGHDARFHGEAKKVARGQLKAEDLPPPPHAEAAAEFQRCVEAEKPIWAAKQALLAKEKAAKAAAKAAKAEAKLRELEERATS